MINPTLGVAENDQGRSGIDQHVGRNIAGMGSAGPDMAVLAAGEDR